MVKGEVTTNEIMEFLQDNMATKEDLGNLKDEMQTEFNTSLRQTEHRILDKMDDKLDDFKGDLVIMMRKEDQKLSALIELLQKKEVLDQEEARSLLRLQPFPQL